MMEIKISGDALTLFDRVRTQLKSPDTLMKVLAKRVKDVYVAHFRAKNKIPNKMGWPINGVWARIARATTVAYAFEDRAGISVADPIINQKIYGGQIKPKNVKSLAIPATAAAYVAGSPREGATPALTFGWGYDQERSVWRPASALTFGWGYDQERSVWRPALVAKDNYQRTTRTGKTVKAAGEKATQGIGTVWYWLVKSVNQPADPTALPPDNIVLNMMRETTLAVHRELLRRRA